MDILFMLGGLLLLFIALPLSIIVTIVFAVKKKKILVPAVCIPVSFLVGKMHLKNDTDFLMERENCNFDALKSIFLSISSIEKECNEDIFDLFSSMSDFEIDKLENLLETYSQARNNLKNFFRRIYLNLFGDVA